MQHTAHRIVETSKLQPGQKPGRCHCDPAYYGKLSLGEELANLLFGEDVKPGNMRFSVR
jgi:hypothetical protein